MGDSKLFKVMKTRDCEALQTDLSRLGEWILMWQMRFKRFCAIMKLTQKENKEV